MAKIVAREENVQAIFEIEEEDGSKYRDAVFWPKSEYDAMTQAQRDQAFIDRYNATLPARAVSAVVEQPAMARVLSSEDQRAESMASLKDTVATLMGDLARVQQQVDALG